MSYQTIPTDASSDNYSFSIELDQTAYVMRLVFNDRDRFWYLDLSDADGARILTGRRLVLNFDLFRLLSASNRPLGGLLLADLTSKLNDGIERSLSEKLSFAYGAAL